MAYSAFFFCFSSMCLFSLFRCGCMEIENRRAKGVKKYENIYKMSNGKMKYKRIITSNKKKSRSVNSKDESK